VREAADDGILVAESLVKARYRFRHALFREALESEIPPAGRCELHCAIGHAIERLHRLHLDGHIDRLAYHFLRGSPHTDWRRAIDYAEAAAARAIERFAYEEGDEYLEAALDLFDAHGDDEARRVAMLLALGACRRKCGGIDESRLILARAVDIARSLGRADLLARAALAYTPWTSYGLTSDTGVALLEEALAAQGTETSPEKAALLARLAHVLDGAAGVRAPRARIVALSREAVDAARTTGDHHTLGRALFAARWVDWDPASFVSRCAMTNELVGVATRHADRELAVIGEGWRITDAMETGDAAALATALRNHASLASELREPEHLWWNAVWRAMCSFMEGRLSESDALIEKAHEIGRRVDSENAELVAYVQSAQVWAERDRLEQVLVALDAIVAARPGVFEGDATIACRKARLLVGLGRMLDARRELERVVRNDFAALKLDMRYTDNLAALAVVCVALDDRECAQHVYRRLEAASGRNLVFGPGLFASGPAALYLGMLAAVTQRHELARRHFTDAITMSRRMGWLPLLAQSQCAHASALLARGRAEDRSAACGLLDEAGSTAEALGLDRVAREAALCRAAYSL